MYYEFSPHNGEYLGAQEPQVDPKETQLAGKTVYMGPARYQTTIAPPAVPKGSVAVFSNGAWKPTEDHRGETWFNAAGDKVVIKDIGNPADIGLLEVEPILPPGPVVAVTRYQAKVALLVSGQLAAVEALMDDPNTSEGAKLAWKEASVFARDSDFIAQLAPALGMNDAELDALFEYAAQVT